MATVPPISVSPRPFDERGRALRLSENEIRERNAKALEALDAIEEIGDEEEQRDTLSYLMRVVDEDRLSNRSRFAS